MYKVEFQAGLNLFDVTWAGLLTPAAIAGYANECRAVRYRENVPPGFRLRITLTDGQPLVNAGIKLGQAPV